MLGIGAATSFNVGPDLLRFPDFDLRCHLSSSRLARPPLDLLTYWVTTPQRLAGHSRS